MPNIQVTRGTSLNDARSESTILINPTNPDWIVAASRKCKDINAYDFTVATVYSTDGGISWHDSAPLSVLGWSGLSDPALAWDDSENVFLIGAAFKNPPKIDYVGIAVYKSIDGGQSWGAPRLIHTSSEDEKPWAAGDTGSISFRGRVYIVWDDAGNLRFARTLDHGNTWIGVGTDPPGSVIASGSFSPEINVAANGDIYVVRSAPGREIKMIVSTDGGDNFQAKPSPAIAITTLEASLAPLKPNGWPVLPGGAFRVFTLPTACVFEQTIAVAWADYREGISQIYYALSIDGGVSWSTGPSGRPLLTSGRPASFHHFHPQMVFNPDGVVGCAFYEFGYHSGTRLIDVIMAQSFDGGNSFKSSRITDQPWNPAVDAPVSLVDPIASFIGEYFGLDASSKGFYPLWTDTRTGIQELWTDLVRALPQLDAPSEIYKQLAEILFGIVQDGGGVELVGGHLRPILPSGPPELDILLGLVNHRIASLAGSPDGIARQTRAMAMIVRAAQQEIRRLEGKGEDSAKITSQ